VSISAHLTPHSSNGITRRSVRENVIRCGADDVSQVEGRLGAPDRGDSITTLIQPQPLIVEARTVVGLDLRALEEAVLLVHLGVHLGEDGQTSLTAQIAIRWLQDPHGLRCADQRPS
jgi:hypothetical protein